MKVYEALTRIRDLTVDPAICDLARAGLEAFESRTWVTQESAPFGRNLNLRVMLTEYDLVGAVDPRALIDAVIEKARHQLYSAALVR